MKAGVGFDTDANGYVAGRRAAEEALRKKGGELSKPDLVLAFCTGALQGSAVLAGIRSAVGPHIPILGGSAAGVITNEQIGSTASQVGVAALDLGGPLAAIAAADGVEKDERKAGKKLGKALADKGATGTSMLLFYDSIRKPMTGTTPAVLNASRALLAGVAEGFPGAPPVVGAGLLGDAGTTQPWQFCGEDGRQQHAAAAVLGSRVKTLVQVMHGCTPMATSHLVTKVKEGVLLQIDGKPAADRIDEILGSKDWRTQRPAQRFTLGVPLGDRLTSLAEDGYVNRLIAGVLPDGKSVALAEPDLVDGTQVVLMERDPAKMAESSRAGAEAAIERLKRTRARPRIALYIDHLGRSIGASKAPSDEAAEIQAVMTREGVALLGFYSGVGVAPVRGVSRGLDYTGVLLLLGEG